MSLASKVKEEVFFLNRWADTPVSERLKGAQLIPGGLWLVVFKEQLPGEHLLFF